MRAGARVNCSSRSTNLSRDTGPGRFGRHVEENNNSGAMFTKMKREYRYFNDLVKKILNQT